MFTQTLALFLFPVLAAAQNYGGPPVGPASSAAATSTALVAAPSAPPSTANQINIDVAPNGMLMFNPSNVSASVGTLVTFYFPNSGLMHSVTQSSFANPCTYLTANTSSNSPAGFDSGLQSAATFAINVTDTNPIWFFCKQISHCGIGMVGSINANNETNTFAQYLAAAKAIGSSETTVPNNGPVISGVHATATGPPVPDLSTGASSSSSTSGAMKLTTSIGLTLFAAVLGVAMA